MTECLQALLVHFFHRCDSTQALRGLAERARKALRIRSRSLKPVARAISSSDSERLSLEPNARRFDPELCDDLGRRAAGFLGENSRELARARVRLLRKLLDRQGLVEMFPREGDRLGHSIGAGIHLQRRGELRLRTGSTMIHDEVLRDSLGRRFLRNFRKRCQVLLPSPSARFPIRLSACLAHWFYRRTPPEWVQVLV